MDSASSWSWVTNNVVMPSRCCSRADLLAQLQPDLGVQRGQRLVEQQHPRLDGERPGQRDPLLLAAGQLVRVLLGLGGQADQVQQLGGPLAPLGRADLAHPQAEGHVVAARSGSGTGCSDWNTMPMSRSVGRDRGRRPCRRPAPRRRRRSRSRRRSAARSSCRSRTGRAGRPARRARCPGQAVQRPGRAEGAGQVRGAHVVPPAPAAPLGRPSAPGGPAVVLVVIEFPIVSVRATVNSVTSPPPVRRDWRVATTVISSRKTRSRAGEERGRDRDRAALS